MGVLKLCCWLLALVGCGVALSESTRLRAQEPVLTDPVRNALGRFAELKTFSVSWRQHDEAGAVTRKKLKLPPVDPETFSVPDTCLLAWQGGKMYLRINEGGREWKDAPNTRRHEFAFDGRILASGSPAQRAPEGGPRSPRLIIDLAENEQTEGEYFRVSTIEPLGIRLPNGAGELLGGKQLTSPILSLLQQGGRLKAIEPAQIDGRAMTRVAILAENPLWRTIQKEDSATEEKLLRSIRTRTEAEIKNEVAVAKRRQERIPRELEYVYFLDPQLGYAVRRFQAFDKSGRLRTEIECTEHEKLAQHEIWLARKCRTANYAVDLVYPGEIFDAPFVTTVLEVSEFGMKPVADELFTLKYSIPGTKVTDMTFPISKAKGPVTYIVPARPDDLDRVIAEARTLAESDGNSATLRTVLIVGNVVGFAALAAFLVIRRLRKAEKS